MKPPIFGVLGILITLQVLRVVNCCIGDSLYPLNGTSCQDIVSTYPYRCYEPDVEQHCCRSCAVVIGQRSECPYGVRTHCSFDECKRDSIHTICCITCKDTDKSTTTVTFSWSDMRNERKRTKITRPPKTRRTKRTKEPRTRRTREPNTRRTNQPNTGDPNTRTRNTNSRRTNEPNTRGTRTRDPNTRTRDPNTRTRDPNTRTRDPNTRTRDPNTRTRDLIFTTDSLYTTTDASTTDYISTDTIDRSSVATEQTSQTKAIDTSDSENVQTSTTDSLTTSTIDTYSTEESTHSSQSMTNGLDTSEMTSILSTQDALSVSESTTSLTSSIYSVETHEVTTGFSTSMTDMSPASTTELENTGFTTLSTESSELTTTEQFTDLTSTTETQTTQYTEDNHSRTSSFFTSAISSSTDSETKSLSTSDVMSTTEMSTTVSEIQSDSPITPDSLISTETLSSVVETTSSLVESTSSFTETMPSLPKLTTSLEDKETSLEETTTSSTETTSYFADTTSSVAETTLIPRNTTSIETESTTITSTTPLLLGIATTESKYSSNGTTVEPTVTTESSIATDQITTEPYSTEQVTSSRESSVWSEASSISAKTKTSPNLIQNSSMAETSFGPESTKSYSTDLTTSPSEQPNLSRKLTSTEMVAAVTAPLALLLLTACGMCLCAKWMASRRRRRRRKHKLHPTPSDSLTDDRLYPTDVNDVDLYSLYPERNGFHAGHPAFFAPQPMPDYVNSPPLYQNYNRGFYDTNPHSFYCPRPLTFNRYEIPVIEEDPMFDSYGPHKASPYVQQKPFDYTSNAGAPLWQDLQINFPRAWVSKESLKAFRENKI